MSKIMLRRNDKPTGLSCPHVHCKEHSSTGLAHPALLRRRVSQKGSFLMEFALCAPVLVLLLAGTLDMGMALNRSLLASQVCRNANVLTVRGIDLSISANQQLLMRTAAGLGMNTSGTYNPNPSGNGVIYLTKVIRVGPLECAVGINNWDGTTATCPNYGLYVIANRIAIGNSTKWSSQTGSPSSTTQSNGNLTDADICTNSGNVALNFPAIITMTNDQYTFVSEVYVDTSMYGIFAMASFPMVYMRNLS